MNQPRLLDAFCCIGGAARGYQQAGFEVTGIDIQVQTAYVGDHFVLGDAVEFIHEHGAEYDVIHASPPCQAYSAPNRGTNKHRGKRHPELIDATRAALESTGRPWIMENVGGAPLSRHLMLCGEMFDLPVIRHRVFEVFGITVLQPPHPKHRGRVRGWRHGQYFDGPYVAVYGMGGGKATTAECKAALGIDWCDDRASLIEALPPAYTEYIGNLIMKENKWTTM